MVWTGWKLIINKEKLLNHGLIGIITLQRILDIFLTYKAMEINKEKFIELNPFMKDLLKNKPLIYLLNIGYIIGLETLNYVANKIEMKKVATAGLSLSILQQCIVLLNNYNNLRELSRSTRWGF